VLRVSYCEVVMLRDCLERVVEFCEVMLMVRECVGAEEYNLRLR
jgi:hypothetical protein